MTTGRLFTVVFLVLVCLIVFSDKGFVGFRESGRKLESLQIENKRIDRENERLRKEILLLRSDFDYIEMIARRELGMIRDDEIVYRFREQ
ncbi:MAG TPA: septum formation initiator family protein [Deltaproteobacteria bacterium]|nr:septum formation initiator family protein [Deltaproteobacteria bacterium]